MFGGNGISLADIAAVMGNNRDGNNGGLGDGNGWWVLIILFALFGGWGNGNGFGSNNGGRSNDCCSTTYIPVPMGGYGMGYGANFTDAVVQRGFDTQSIIQKLDGLNSGVCSLGYDQLAQMNGINSNIMQRGFETQQAINGASVANMQSFNALSTQLANCCCENRQGQAQIEFALSQLGCALTNTMNQNTRDIMEANCTGFRNLGDQIQAGFTQLAMNQKDAEISNLRTQLNLCNMQGIADAAVQSAVSQVRPTAVPAYPASNPCGMGNWAPEVLSGYGYDRSGCCGSGRNWGSCCG